MAATFVARRSISHLLLLACGAAAFVLIGVWIVGAFGSAPRDGGSWAGWAAITFFGACLMVIILRLFDPDDQIVINDSGFRRKLWSETTIPWTEVTDVQERIIHRQHMLCIYLAHPERFRPTTLLGRAALANKALGFGDIALNTAGTDKSHAELKAAVLAHWPAASERSLG